MSVPSNKPLPPNVRIQIETSADGNSDTLYFVDAPVSKDQVESLNACQASGRMHPFTCGGDRGDDAHRAYQAAHGGDRGQLVATETGWVCPVCGDPQDWARLWMADWSWRR